VYQVGIAYYEIMYCITLQTQWNKPRGWSMHKREEGNIQMNLLKTHREYVFFRDNSKKTEFKSVPEKKIS
jgi:hypothetical protein